MTEYELFANDEFEIVSKSQELFITEYDINSYANWFYDQESELLRLYNQDGSELFFKYIPVGSYSLKSNTWMWSWNNDGSIEKHKNTTLKAKELGLEHDFKYLKKGLFEYSQDECWKLTAISKNLIGGIGVYCTKSNDFFKYVILKEPVVDLGSKEIRKMKQMTVECGQHGYRRPAFVCQHLNVETPKGFEESFESTRGMDLDDDDDFAAWCNKCESHRIMHRGWNEESEKFAQIKLICEECYFELKECNK